MPKLHYNNFNGGKQDQLDIHRFVLAVEYDFDDRTTFVGEFEIEHGVAGEDKPGEVEVEQAYINFEINDDLDVQAGVMLLPVSHLNMYHEPNTFHGVERPHTEKVLIPTTWWEGGVGVRGTVEDSIRYWATLTTSLDQEGFDADGIRGGRQKAAEAGAEELMLTARVEYQPAAEWWMEATVFTWWHKSRSKVMLTVQSLRLFWKAPTPGSSLN